MKYTTLKLLVLLAMLVLVMLISGISCTKTGTSGLQKQFVDGFIAAHNSMALAENLQPQAADAATGGQYALAVQKMTEASADAQQAFISNPTGVVAEMQKQNIGVSEGKAVDLLSTRITSFTDGAEHFLTAMRYAQQGDLSRENQEIGLSNTAFNKSWQSEYALQDLVTTDTNLNYLRKAVGW